MKLVIVVDVEGVDPVLTDPHTVAESLLDLVYDQGRAIAAWSGGPSMRGRSWRFLSAGWEDTVRRSSVDELLDDEDE